MRQINPNLLKLAELTHNPELKIDESVLERDVKEITNVPNLEGFIHIPSINLYVAKEKTLHGKNWYQTYEELYKQNLQMPTIPQFIEFIKYLKDGYQDRKEAGQILDEILAVRAPWRAEWLDAGFKVINNELHINYNHRTVNDGLKPQISEPLEDCLMEDKTPGISLDYWLNNPTKQGLPRKNTPNGDLYYWCPMKDNNSVARFYANFNGAGLNCGGGPGDLDSLLGVFACVEGTPRKT